VRTLAAIAALALLAGCSSSTPAAPDAAPRTAGAEGVRAVLDGVELRLEVADDARERSIGLMGRTSVPSGTGMVFLYDEPVSVRFYMFRVPVPLRAVFVREGVVVASILMPPCAQAVGADCPTYGPDAPYDTVVETAPATLPDVQPGDRLEPAQPGA